MAEAIRSQFGLVDDVSVLAERFHREFVATFEADVGVAEALGAARSAGWSIAIVTNGGPMQEAKIRAAGMSASSNAPPPWWGTHSKPTGP